MSLVEDLLVVLSSYHDGYRLMRRRMRGDTRSIVPPKRLRDVSDNILQATLSRLKKRGLVKNDQARGIWNITEKGSGYLSRLLVRHKYKNLRATHKQKPKNMILAFDIPERHRRERDWLRLELRNLGFEMLQKSMWFGAAPLPKDFVVSLQETRILPFIKFFKAEGWDIV